MSESVICALVIGMELRPSGANKAHLSRHLIWGLRIAFNLWIETTHAKPIRSKSLDKSSPGRMKARNRDLVEPIESVEDVVDEPRNRASMNPLLS